MASTTLKPKLANPETRTNWLIAMVIFVMPLGYDSLTNVLLIFFVIHTIATVNLTDWVKAIKNPIYLVSGLFFLYYASTLFWSTNHDDGLRQLETKLSFFLAPLFVAANSKWLGQVHLKYQKRALIWGCFATMILAFGIAVSKSIEAGHPYFISPFGKEVSFFTYTMLADPFMHVGYLSTFVGIAILLLLDDIVYYSQRRVLNVALMVALLFFMFMLQGRMNVLALVVILGVAFVYYVVKFRSYKWLVLPIIPLIIGVIALPILPDSFVERYFQFPDLNYKISGEATDFNSATYRLAEWKGASRVISEHPFFGTGVGDNREALTTAYDDIGFHVGVERKFNAHNQYLETTIAAGFVGLFFLLVLIGFWLNTAWRKGDIPIALAISYFVLCMLTESMFERAWAVVFFAVFFAVMLLASDGSQKEANKKS